MPQFIYRVRPTRPGMLADGPTERESRIVEDHFRYLERLAADGTVLLAGRTLTTDEHAFGIVVLEAATEEAATTVMREDPAVAEGVMRAELRPFRVALWSARGPGNGGTG